MSDRVPNQEMHRIATTAIIYRDDGRMLITKRSEHKKAWPGKWTVPGGGLETDDYTPTKPTIGTLWYEVVERSVRREVQEEVGLVIGKPQLLVDATFIRPDGVPVLILSYFAKYVSGEVVLGADEVDFAWVSLEESRDYDLIEGIHEELVMLGRRLRGDDPIDISFVQ